MMRLADGLFCTTGLTDGLFYAAESIVNATPINGEQYSKLIEMRNEKTRDDLLSMKRYVLTNTFDKKDVALETCQDMIEKTVKQKMVENTKKRRIYYIR